MRFHCYLPDSNEHILFWKTTLRRYPRWLVRNRVSVLSPIVKTIRLRARVFYEQRVNEALPGWLSLVKNSGLRSNWFRTKYLIVFTSAIQMSQTLRAMCTELWNKHHVFKKNDFHWLFTTVVYQQLYNNLSYFRLLIGSRLWFIKGQMHNWRHHYKVFPSVF